MSRRFAAVVAGVPPANGQTPADTAALLTASARGRRRFFEARIAPERIVPGEQFQPAVARKQGSARPRRAVPAQGLSTNPRGDDRGIQNHVRPFNTSFARGTSSIARRISRSASSFRPSPASINARGETAGPYRDPLAGSSPAQHAAR